MLLLQELRFIVRKSLRDRAEHFLRRFRTSLCPLRTFAHADEHARFVLAVILYFGATNTGSIECATDLFDADVLLELKLYFGAAGEVDAIFDAAKHGPHDTGKRNEGRDVIP